MFMVFTQKDGNTGSLPIAILVFCPNTSNPLFRVIYTKTESNVHALRCYTVSENKCTFGKAIAQAAQEYLEGIAMYNQKIVATHIVAKGETLSSIARKYGVTVHELQTVNKITNKNVIYVGQQLSIPEKE